MIFVILADYTRRTQYSSVRNRALDHRSGHFLKLGIGQFRIDWQGENFGGSLFGGRKIAAGIAQGFVGGLQMNRDWIVDAGLNFTLL